MQRWAMSDGAAEVWGAHAAGACMHSSFLKGEERVIVNLESEGPLGGLAVECISLGEVRGSVRNPDAEPASEGASMLGPGFMTVRKVLYNQATPYDATVESTGDASLDWGRFYERSEQTDTFVLLEASLRPGRPPFVGGITVQALPGSEGAAAVFTLQTKLQHGELPSLAGAAEEHGMLGAVAAFWDLSDDEGTLLDRLEEDGAAYRRLDYFCRCNREGFLGHMASLPRGDLEELVDQGGAELRCHHCNEAHALQAGEIAALLVTN
jgi:molecular chaperone Hsp33